MSKNKNKSKNKNPKKNIKNSLSISARSVEERDRDILFALGVNPDRVPREEMSQVIYYTCIKNFSESIGKLPLKYFQETENGIIIPEKTESYRLLALRPNDYMTASVFWSLQERNCLHYGNSFSLIDGEMIDEKYGGTYNIYGIYPLDNNCVQVIMDDIGKGVTGTKGNIVYEYSNPYTGEVKVFKSSEIFHFKNWFTKDGIMGLPARYSLVYMMEGEQAADDFLRNLYRNGLSARMVMQYASNLDDDRIKQIEKKFASRLMGPQAAGKIVPVPQGLEILPLTNSLVDNQFLELRKFSALQICAAFGVKPSMINLYSDSKYNSVETEQLAFLDSLAFRLKMYEEEINSKILLPSEYKNGCFYKFNEKAILRTSSEEQSVVLKNYVQGGIYTPNEARDYLDKPHIEGGDTLMINGSYVPVSDVGAAYKDKVKTKTNGGKK